MKTLVSMLPENSKGECNLESELSGVGVISQSAWEKINAFETSEGEKVGKPRRKIVAIEALISASK
jgi:hypothetical protein